MGAPERATGSAGTLLEHAGEGSPVASAAPHPTAPRPLMTGTALALLTCTALLVSFSESMLIPALPTIQAQFGSNAADISWVPAIYLLVGAISVPLFGKLGDLYGKKRMLTFVMLAYSIAVILDGFAWNLPSLLVFRAVQGLGLAMFPLAISLIHDEAVAARVPVAVGLITSMNGVGAAIGLIGGAYITQTFSWQTNYNLLAPFAVVLTLLLYLVARESTQLTRERIDYVGLSIFGLTITMLLLAISEGGILGWTSTATITLFALSAIFAVALVVAERHVTNPLFEIHLPEVGSILKVDFAMLVAGAVMFMGFYMVIYFAQEPTIGLGRDVEKAALILAPAALLMLVFAPLGGRLAQRWGSKPVELIGTFLVIVGFVSLLLLHSGAQELGAGCVVLFAGVSFLLTALSISILILSPAGSVGSEVGLNTSFRTLGQAIGVAISGAFLAGFLVPGTLLPSDEAYALTAYAGIALGIVALLLLASLPNLKVKGSPPLAE